MRLQYITDSNGQTTGVFIPIQEWNDLQSKLGNIEENLDVPEWHKEVLLKRMEDYSRNPNQALDFDDTMDEIEKNL